MSRSSQHPDLLLYVAGRLEPGQAAEVAAHLAACPECGSEAEALSSMRTTLIARIGAGHVRAEDLVLYEDGGLEGRPELTASIEGHLESCADCAADLGSLRQSRGFRAEPDRASVPRPVDPAPPRLSRRVWALAAVLLAAVALALFLRRALTGVPGTPDGRDAPITFAPPRRGQGDESRLAANGPWAVSIVLPFGAPAGDYVLRIERQDGSIVRRFPSPLASDGSRLDVFVGPLPPGAYSLVVAPASGADAPSVYRFQVQGEGP